MEDALELVMTPTLGAAGVRVRLVKRITSIGSAPDADLRFHSLPAHWATVQRDSGGAIVNVLGGGSAHRLLPGERVTVEGMTVELGRPEGLVDTAIDELAARLAAVDTPDDGLAAILDGAIAAAGADLGAIVLGDGAGWTVAAARDAAGAPVADAVELLAEPIVRDVLATGERVTRAPSVSALGLATATCLPLRLDTRTLGALFVGVRARRTPFGERAASDLRLLTALALPFVAQLRRRAGAPAGLDALVGESAAMDQLRRLIRRVGPTDLSVLVVGAPGTGKALVARAIHAASVRQARPLVALQGATVPAGGVIEAADGSTLFLDEVGDMPLATQAALLRALEQRRIDFRVIAATSRDLVADVAAGRFREDLLVRLQEMRVDVPPLRDRGDDVLQLARLFLRQTEAQLALPVHTLAGDAIDLLLRYPWPGNVRELKAAVRRAAILAESAAVRAEDLQLSLPPPAIPRPPTPPMGIVAPVAPLHDLGDTSRALADARDDFVRRYVAAVLERCAGNREAAARQLDIGVRTLYRYLG